MYITIYFHSIKCYKFEKKKPYSIGVVWQTKRRHVYILTRVRHPYLIVERALVHPIATSTENENASASFVHGDIIANIFARRNAPFVTD